MQPEYINCDDQTVSLSFKPIFIPSKYPMHDQNVLQIKNPIYFISYQTNSKPTSDVIRYPFMFYTVQPSLLNSHLPSSVTIFDPSHSLISPPGLFLSDVPPYLTRLCTSSLSRFYPNNLLSLLLSLLTFNVPPDLARSSPS